MKEEVYGHFRHSIGANRVRIPSDYRKFLSDELVFALPGKDGCFLLVPKSNLGEILGQYDSNDPYFSEKMEFVRRVNNDTIKAVIDSQFRLTISPEMRDLCEGMDSAIEVEFCGRGKFIEVWPARVYDKMFKENKQDFNAMISALKAKLNK